MRSALLTFVLGCVLLLDAGTAYGKSVDFAKLTLIAGCRLHRIDGTYIREFPGNMCLFMKDGRYVSADASRIVMYAPDKSQIWKIDGHYHHQLNWSEDGNSILALSSKFPSINGTVMRVDVLQRISLEGKVTGAMGSDEIYDALRIKYGRSPFTWDPGIPGKAAFEISHYNSFHEIPSQTKPTSKNIRAGNYIANTTFAGAVILDKDLKIPLERIQFPTSRDQAIHDVQVRSDGRILMLNNERVRGADTVGPRSAIEFFDPVVKRSTYTFEAQPPEMFYTPFSGGVQPIGEDLVFISHVSNAYFFLDIKSKKIVRSDVLRDNFGVPNMIPVQQIKAEDLSEFLKKW